MSDCHSLTLYAAGLTVCFAVALLSACGGQNAEPPAPRPVLTVELVSPARASWPEFIVASGEVAPWQEASIGAEVSGIRLDKVLVNVGDVVTRGSSSPASARTLCVLTLHGSTRPSTKPRPIL